MKAKELRIGNLVTGYSYDVAISLEDFKDFYTGDDNIDSYKPIPLTEEWLLKFGFENQLVEFVLDNFYLKRTKNHFEYYCNNRAEIKYVHQLQNLYFALIGKELEYSK